MSDVSLKDIRVMQRHWTPNYQVQCDDPNCAQCWAGASASDWPRGDTKYGATRPATREDLIAALHGDS